MAFPFQCQNCTGEPLFFMVRRDGLKLTMVGRSQFEDVQVPKYVPKPVAKHYEGAIVSFQTGRSLAGIFYLRTMIEQYMRGIVKPAARLTGDQLADEYGKTLPTAFSERYPSFRKIYEDLSGAIHEAREDDVLFQKAVGEIESHLEAKPFFMEKPRLE